MSASRRARGLLLRTVFVGASLAFVGCSDEAPPSPRADLPPSPEVAMAVARAAEAVWKAIDDYDAKAFAALSVEPKDATFRTLEAKDVESLVTELHQKYGARPHRLAPGPAPTTSSTTSTVYMIVGDREDALSLTFSRLAAGWKLSTISNADPAAVDPNGR